MTEPQTLRNDPNAESPQHRDDLWRNEIPARVAGYRHRRGRRIEGAFSMRFPFPPAEPEASASASEKQACETGDMNPAAGDSFLSASAATADAAELMAPLPGSTFSTTVAGEQSETGIAAVPEEPEVVWFVPDAAPGPDPPPTPAPVLQTRGKRKVLAFPRSASSAPETFHRLADPVVPEQPRILDVPEELEAFPTPPLLDGLQFPASAQQAAATPADHIELPFQAVNISQRLYAGLVDCALVTVAAGIFGAVSYKMLPRLTLTKPVLLAAGGVIVLLWAAYQYVFLMYGGATPGMRTLRIRLSTFNGRCLSWRHRRSRAIGLYFSTASLMMGLFWVLVDVDVLCWHDRISRTYLTNQKA